MKVRKVCCHYCGADLELDKSTHYVHVIIAVLA
jgi:hypothetical protein